MVGAVVNRCPKAEPLAIRLFVGGGVFRVGEPSVVSVQEETRVGRSFRSEFVGLGGKFGCVGELGIVVSEVLVFGIEGNIVCKGMIRFGPLL